MKPCRGALWQTFIVLVMFRGASAQNTSSAEPAAVDQACVDQVELAHLENLTVTSKNTLHTGSLEALVASVSSTINVAGNTTTGLDLAHTDLREQISEFTRTIDDHSQPMPIQKSRILDNPLATSSPFTPPLHPEEKEMVVQRGKSVGHLMSQTSDANGKPTYFPWGTTFVVAPGIVATNCHVLDSLVMKENGNWQLVPEARDTLVIDFGDKSSVSTDHAFRVTGLAASPDHTGFDVAFLAVSSESITGHNVLPGALPLEKKSIASPLLGSPELFVLVGYPDTRHSIDPNVNATYAPFRDQGYAKFAVLGGVTAINKCQAPLEVILDTASTTEGQSGSVLIDRRTFNVIGIHDCCATYSTKQNAPRPPADFPCATLRTTYYNQAISSWSIVEDPVLGQILKHAGVVP